MSVSYVLHSRNIGHVSVRTGSPVPESGCVFQIPGESSKFFCKLCSAQQVGTEAQTWKTPFTVSFGVARALGSSMSLQNLFHNPLYLLQWPTQLRCAWKAGGGKAPSGITSWVQRK